MSEEKILGGEDGIEKKQAEEGDLSGEQSLEKTENSVEQTVDNSAEKIKQAQGQIDSSLSNIKDDKKKIINHTKDVAGLETVEDQIQKLTEIAVQDGPKTALKVARALNSNYTLDEMHDRLVDEEDLRKILIQKGFIEKTE